jgi:hypothetical protein
LIPKDAKKPIEDLIKAFENDDPSAASKAAEALEPIVNREYEKALRKAGITEKSLAERIAKHNKKKKGKK